MADLVLVGDILDDSSGADSEDSVQESDITLQKIFAFPLTLNHWKDIGNTIFPYCSLTFHNVGNTFHPQLSNNWKGRFSTPFQFGNYWKWSLEIYVKL